MWVHAAHQQVAAAAQCPHRRRALACAHPAAAQRSQAPGSQCMRATARAQHSFAFTAQRVLAFMPGFAVGDAAGGIAKGPMRGSERGSYSSSSSSSSSYGVLCAGCAGTGPADSLFAPLPCSAGPWPHHGRGTSIFRFRGELFFSGAHLETGENARSRAQQQQQTYRIVVRIAVDAELVALINRVPHQWNLRTIARLH